jgi:8-oxo-dGTP diphosphatase
LILATLLYIKNDKKEFLLLERNKDPNKGMLSPPGGKVNIELPESPVMCAVREAFEECGIRSKAEDWKLLGIITEKNFPGIGNIMIFLYYYKNPVNILPEICNEGGFHFIHPSELLNYPIPVTDEKVIWNLVLNKEVHPFDVIIDCSNYPDLEYRVN